MKVKTHLPGKDAALEDTVATTLSLLENLGIEVEPVSWLNPTPNCWSVHLRSKTCLQLYSNGKGTSRIASLASALGEFMERLSTNFFFADCYLEQNVPQPTFLFYPDEKWFHPKETEAIHLYSKDGSELLSSTLLGLYNPTGELTTEHLYDNNSDSANRGICTLPFQNLANDKTVYFPVSLLNNLYVSNGMAAGNSQTESCSQALSEILERYVKKIIISQGISLPDVPTTILDNYPKLIEIIKELARHHFVVRVKDGSLGGKYPVICVLLTNPANRGVYAAFGANCRFEVAVERTLTELLQGRSLGQLDGFQPPCHDLELVADSFNLESHFVDSDGLLSWEMFRDEPDFSFHPWDFSGSTEIEFQQLSQLITSLGYEIYRAEYQQYGMYSCRILVPGMSEIYPIDDLIWNNKSTGAQLRSYLLNLPTMEMDELTKVLGMLDELGLSDQQLILDIIGVYFDEHSTWFSLRIGELKALIYLAMRQEEEALQWCNWCIDFGALPEKRQRLFQTMQTLLNFTLSGKTSKAYATNLNIFYTDEEIKEAESVVSGAVTFPGLNFAACWTDVSTVHKQLLLLYNSLQTSK